MMKNPPFKRQGSYAILFCPECSSNLMRVVDSRAMGSLRWRRRGCEVCGYRHNTVEITLDEYNDLRGAVSASKDMDRLVRAARVFKNELELLTMRNGGTNG